MPLPKTAGEAGFDVFSGGVYHWPITSEASKQMWERIAAAILKHHTPQDVATHIARLERMLADAYFCGMTVDERDSIRVAVALMKEVANAGH
jgi:hypothetical protein